MGSKILALLRYSSRLAYIFLSAMRKQAPSVPNGSIRFNSGDIEGVPAVCGLQLLWPARVFSVGKKAKSLTNRRQVMAIP
jgi:hypothetical protein